MRKRGRPSKKTPAVLRAILAALESGESLRMIAKRPGMPAPATVLDWVAADEHFSEQYEIARNRGLDAMRDDMLEIADDGTNDYVESVNSKGEVKILVDKDHIARSRLRVDTRKWYLSKLAPKRYGDRIATEISGPDGGPVQFATLADIVKAAAKAKQDAAATATKEPA